jgi:hypothetical protein
MDPALERLVDPESAGCVVQPGQETPSAPIGSYTGVGACRPDNRAFKRLMSQWGFAFAPTAMHSARTTGYGGFHLSLEGAYTDIDQGADYWQLGTRGPDDPITGLSSYVNSSPQPILQVYSLKLRKGFSMGLEVTGSMGFMPKTSIVSGGADVRMAFLEGFRTGVLGWFPDIAAGGGVRTITGTPQFQLTVVGVDAQISKPVTIADSAVLTPWIGFQHLWTFADSGLIDLTPATDAIQYCNYVGPDVPGGAGDQNNGQPVCAGGSNQDFGNNVVFERARLERRRLLLGLSYRYETFMLALQFIADAVPPEKAQNSAQDRDDLAGQPSQYTGVIEIGAMF